MAGTSGSKPRPGRRTRKKKRTKSQIPPWRCPELVLGWKVTKGFEPEHWHKPNAKPGRHALADVVRTAARAIAHHTVVIAQSGSGKSFFLGRLLEEIVLKTRSRLLILDSNSDFRMIAEAKSEKFWTDKEYRYDRTSRRGFLADERSRRDFFSRWKEITTLLHTDKAPKKGRSQPLWLDWLDFPIDVLADEIGPEHRDDLRHCHSFVKLLAKLAWSTKKEGWLRKGAFLGRAYRLCKEMEKEKKASEGNNNKNAEATMRALLEKQFGAGDAQDGSDVKTIPPSFELVGPDGSILVGLPPDRKYLWDLASKRQPIASKDLGTTYAQALSHRQFFGESIINAYFSRASEFEKAKLVNPSIRGSYGDKQRPSIEVVDLPSLPDSLHQKFAISTFLETAWMRAREDWEEALGLEDRDDDERVPTFIVVEEAHNLMPNKAKTPIEKKLQEQFRRVAAEGRKFGLFLILVSQRPDKLDRMVMSECENRAVMRVGSSFILRTTCEILGLDGMVPRMTEKVLDFDLGRALLVGPWVADEPAFLVSAARRTKEGGRDLQADHWAVDPFDLGGAQKRAPRRRRRKS